MQRAVVTEVEAGLSEMYELGLAGKKEVFKREDLIPALLVPLNLVTIKFQDYFILILFLPIFIT